MDKTNAVYLDKATDQMFGQVYQFDNMTGDIYREPVKPELLTSLLSGSTTNEYLESNDFKYDELVKTATLPESKRFDEYGPDVTPDKAKRKIFSVGSHGIRANARPEDIAKRINPRTKQKYTVAEKVEELQGKIDQGWSAYTEKAYAQLLTAETNIGDASKCDVYNFYEDIVGTARPAATTIDYTNDGEAEIRDAIYLEQDKQSNVASKYQVRVQDKVMICGSAAFSKAWEAEGLFGMNRSLSATLDLATTNIPRTFFDGDVNFAVQNFRSELDGMLYIRVTGQIDGTNLIGTNDMYMVPVIDEGLMTKVFAPAQRMDTINEVAQESYTFVKENEWGVCVASESNVLYASLRPDLIRHLTAA